MQQGHHYHRFGYQPFNEQQQGQNQAQSQFPPQSQPGYGQPYPREGEGRFSGAAGGVFVRRAGAMLTSPLAMTGVLIAAAVAFAGVFIMSSPSSDDIPQPIPIVQAESGALKSAPDEAGGMEIANRDTTVFDAIKDENAEARPVENLLEAVSHEEEQPMSRQELAGQLATQEGASQGAEAPKVAEAIIPVPAETQEETVDTLVAPESKTPDAGKTAMDAAEASAKGIPLPRPEILQKGPQAAPAVPMHEPGASPDTIAFVRDVLGKKDEKTAASAAVTHHPEIVPEPGKQEIYGSRMASVSPAAGAVSPAAAAPKIAPAGGGAYVQVVSVPSRAAAESEWGKLQKSLSSVLGGAPYRIQEANLGEKGTYYRVQVGPYAEADAKSLCSQIKAQKPGGCLVVH